MYMAECTCMCEFALFFIFRNGIYSQSQTVASSRMLPTHLHLPSQFNPYDKLLAVSSHSVLYLHRFVRRSYKTVHALTWYSLSAPF
uniref:Uncharacterized protein n=1 Tax=Arundo donax TaxID=35708 RepID=A0A0A9CJA0_ARUDO